MIEKPEQRLVREPIVVNCPAEADADAAAAQFPGARAWNSPS